MSCYYCPYEKAIPALFMMSYNNPAPSQSKYIIRYHKQQQRLYLRRCNEYRSSVIKGRAGSAKLSICETTVCTCASSYIGLDKLIVYLPTA